MFTLQEILKELFVTGLRNAHAVEKQALSIMTPQVERIVNYPEMADRLRLHIDETHGQIVRLDEILAGLDTSASVLKDMARHRPCHGRIGRCPGRRDRRTAGARHAATDCSRMGRMAAWSGGPSRGYRTRSDRLSGARSRRGVPQTVTAVTIERPQQSEGSSV